MLKSNIQKSKNRSLTIVLLMVLFGIAAYCFTFSYVTEYVLAQSIAVPKTLDTSFVDDPVYTSLKEFSSLPIDVNTVTVGRTNPFIPSSDTVALTNE
ncbi:hypothetical protein KKH43_01730 [Patescibacteria group bacterium]|nr:hypothetical protein [Patescibacteria group bacterium]